MPIYGLDSVNNSTIYSVNVTENMESPGNVSHYHDQSSDLENTKSGKYKDIQDLRLKLLEILEGIRLARAEDSLERRSEFIQLEKELKLLKKQMNFLI